MIPNSGRMGVCCVCKSETFMTIDHIVPKWFLIDCARFGVDWADIVLKSKLEGKLLRDICGPCNVAKGGIIMWHDPTTRAFLKQFIIAVADRFKEYEGPRKLNVICGCGRKEPCAVVPGVMSSTSVPKHQEVKVTHKHWAKKCWCGHTETPLMQGEPTEMPVTQDNEAFLRRKGIY